MEAIQERGLVKMPKSGIMELVKRTDLKEAGPDACRFLHF